MLFSEDAGHGQYQIKSYQTGSIVINEHTYTNSLIISAHKLIEPWRAPAIERLSLDDLAPALACHPDIVLLGTGPTFIIPPTSFMEAVRAQHLGLEFMDTAAACRTFIALSAEGRNVVAALML